MLRLYLTLTLEQWKKKRPPVNDERETTPAIDAAPSTRPPMIGEMRPCFHGDCVGRQVFVPIQRLVAHVEAWRCGSCGRTELE